MGNKIKEMVPYLFLSNLSTSYYLVLLHWSGLKAMLQGTTDSILS